jgi:hypothetical protein
LGLGETSRSSLFLRRRLRGRHVGIEGPRTLSRCAPTGPQRMPSRLGLGGGGLRLVSETSASCCGQRCHVYHPLSLVQIRSCVMVSRLVYHVNGLMFPSSRVILPGSRMWPNLPD